MLNGLSSALFSAILYLFGGPSSFESSRHHTSVGHHISVCENKTSKVNKKRFKQNKKSLLRDSVRLPPVEKACLRAKM